MFKHIFKQIVLINCICFIFALPGASAREAFEFTAGEKINAISDKGFRRIKDNIVEAIGNVIITQKSNALYGEKATMNLESGDMEIEGNVRFISPELTLYGSRIEHNSKTQFLTIYDARLVNDNYIVLGKKLIRLTPQTYIGNDAEYTTCRDCPESWSIFGKKVHVTVGKYIRAWHALIKVNGVVVMYVPYILLPIKTKRETGLLYPSFRVSAHHGIKYQQPWFWAIGPHNDMTLVPGVFAKRGYVNELQYRQVLGDQKWFELNSLQALDRLYAPNNPVDETRGHYLFRHFWEYEHHFTFGNYLTHHLDYTKASDLDTVSDYNGYTDAKVRGAELGGETFFDFRTALIDLNVEAYYKKNRLVDDVNKFDNSLVQILPKVSLSTTPATLIHTSYPLLHNVAFGLDTDFTVFKQNRANETYDYCMSDFPSTDCIRNTYRTNAGPYIDWQILSLGPFGLKTNLKLDYQHYRFPSHQRGEFAYEDRSKSFRKQGLVYETQMGFTVEKIFGLAYHESVPLERVKFKESEKKEGKEKEDNGSDNLIGDLPHFDDRYTKESVTISHNSYRHAQDFLLKHYYLDLQKQSGNSRFSHQIRDQKGLFDYLDVVKGNEEKLKNAVVTTDIPVKNTVEFQWNNTLIKKTPQKFDPFVDQRYLNQNFSYSPIAYFNVSQGYNFHMEEGKKFIEHLTRLQITGSMPLKKFTISGTENYLYLYKRHKHSLNVSRSFSLGSLSASYNYNPLERINDTTKPIVKTLGLKGKVSPFGPIALAADIDFDLEESELTRYSIGMQYSPPNNCWKTNVTYEWTRSGDIEILFNLLVNFNDNVFTSITEGLFD